MRIILTHENTDFDALASLVAAARIYPDARPVLGRRVIEPVRDFMAVHRDRIDLYRYSDIQPEAVDSLIVVDTRNPDRLPPIGDVLERARARQIEVHLYDHHRAADDDLVGDVEIIEPVGSCATLLVEAYQRLHLQPDPIEATLLLLGVYADTGNLCFPNTTARDLYAAGWLLERGPRLSVVNRFLRVIFSEPQRQVITRLINEIEILEIGGVRIGLAALELGEFLGGLATVTRHVLNFEGLDALFVAFGVGRRGAQLVARSNVPWIDVGAVLARFGGGGHTGAAAGRLKDRAPAVVIREIREHFEHHPPRPRRVTDIMSSPVRTVPPDTSLRELQGSLAAWRHTGVPVCREGRMIGIISRRDVEAAERGDRLHLPVSSCMSHEVHTITPNTSLEEALQHMITHNVGRLPVVHEDRLVGIISRTDLLRVLYEPHDEDPQDAL